MCGDLGVMGDKNTTTEDSVVEDIVASFGNKKNPITAILKTTQQRIMSRTIMMMLGMKPTILMN